MSFKEEEQVKDFKEKCTTVDENVVSRAIFPDGVRIRYISGNQIELIPEVAEFTFSKVSVLINHMVRHGFTAKDSVVGAMLEQAATNLPVENGLVLRCAKGSPTFVVAVTHDEIELMPVTERYIQRNAKGFCELVKKLSGEGAISSAEVDEKGRLIRVIPSRSICDALKAVSTALDSIGAIGNSTSVLAQLVDMALLYVTANELRTVRNISRYPETHPLSKYKDTALVIEDILAGIRGNRALDEPMKRKLAAALEGSGEFSALPSILTRGFAKLSKDFPGKLEQIMRNPLA